VSGYERFKSLGCEGEPGVKKEAEPVLPSDTNNNEYSAFHNITNHILR